MSLQDAFFDGSLEFPLIQVTLRPAYCIQMQLKYSAYVCNDEFVFKIDQFDDNSDSVFLLFYRCDDLSQRCYFFCQRKGVILPWQQHMSCYCTGSSIMVLKHYTRVILLTTFLLVVRFIFVVFLPFCDPISYASVLFTSCPRT